MTPQDFTINDELLRDRLRALALPTETVPQWDDVCRRAAPQRWARRQRRARPLALVAVLLTLAGAAAAIADVPLPSLPWQGDAVPGWHDGEIQALPNMAVFHTPRGRDDVLPSDLTAAARQLTASPPYIPDGLLPGAALVAQSRLLLSEAGPRHSHVYALPTAKGQVCVLVQPGGATCFGGFARPSHPIILLPTDNLLVGLVPDQVTAITAVLAGGSTLPVTVHRNAFAIASPKLAAIQHLRLTYTDGSTTTIDVPRRPQRIPS